METCLRLGNQTPDFRGIMLWLVATGCTLSSFVLCHWGHRFTLCLWIAGVSLPEFYKSFLGRV